MNAISISRRKFARLLGTGAACAVAKPAFSFAAAAAIDAPASGIVRLSSNENPYGPSPKALKAMTDAFGLACRYPDEHEGLLIDAIAKIDGVTREQILLGDGSSEILKLCASAFTGPNGKLIVGDPTFEALVNYATVRGAEVVKVPLTSSFAHDLSKMGDAAKAGLAYVCNPNNPTASITPKDALRDFIAKVSPKTMILVDEAYFHYADSSVYESVIPLVKDHPNLIVARTFSKIYGMAGLRCGYCIAQPAVNEKLRSHQPWDSVNIMALTAGIANLADPEQVVSGRKRNSDTRSFVTAELETMGYKIIPSQANFIMVDVKQPVVPLIQAMKERKVRVGRSFPSLPTHMRVTIGTETEMEAFLTAFRQVLA